MNLKPTDLWAIAIVGHVKPKERHLAIDWFEKHGVGSEVIAIIKDRCLKKDKKKQEFK